MEEKIKLGELEPGAIFKKDETYVVKSEQNKWLVSERLTHQELRAKLIPLKDKFIGKLVKHIKSGNLYRISNCTILNMNGVAEIAVEYHPYDKISRDNFDIKFTRPAREFFDGRFKY